MKKIFSILILSMCFCVVQAQEEQNMSHTEANGESSGEYIIVKTVSVQGDFNRIGSQGGHVTITCNVSKKHCFAYRKVRYGNIVGTYVF